MDNIFEIEKGKLIGFKDDIRLGYIFGIAEEVQVIDSLTSIIFSNDVVQIGCNDERCASEEIFSICENLEYIIIPNTISTYNKV